MRRASVDFGSRISSLANNGNQTIHKEIAESEIPEDFLGSDNFEVSARDPNKSSNNLMAKTDDKHNGYDFYLGRNKGNQVTQAPLKALELGLKS